MPDYSCFLRIKITLYIYIYIYFFPCYRQRTRKCVLLDLQHVHGNPTSERRSRTRCSERRCRAGSSARWSPSSSILSVGQLNLECLCYERSNDRYQRRSPIKYTCAIAIARQIESSIIADVHTCARSDRFIGIEFTEHVCLAIWGFISLQIEPFSCVLNPCVFYRNPLWLRTHSLSLIYLHKSQNFTKVPNNPNVSIYVFDVKQTYALSRITLQCSGEIVSLTERSTRNLSKIFLNCFSMEHSENWTSGRNAGGGRKCARATELVDRIKFFLYVYNRFAHTPTHARAYSFLPFPTRTYVREMHDNDCTSFRWPGRPLLALGVHTQTYCASVNEIWNVETRECKGNVRRTESEERAEEMEIEIADPTLSNVCSVSRAIRIREYIAKRGSARDLRGFYRDLRMEKN